jgi:hypothetical protein
MPYSPTACCIFRPVLQIRVYQICPAAPARFESGMTLNPQEYADTVCYNWLEQNNFKVKVNPSSVNIGIGAVDLLGRYRLGNQ